MAKVILFIVASPSKWIWNQKAPRFQSCGDSWSPHPVISCCHPDPRGNCTCDPFPWFPLAYTPHTPHPIIAFKVSCPLDPAAFFSVLSTVDFLPFLSLCSNNRNNGHLRIHIGVSSSRRPSWIPPHSFVPTRTVLPQY